jgi:hypothetical protein
VKVELVNAEVLTVHEDEALIIKLDARLDDATSAMVLETFEAIGIKRERIIIMQGGVELAKIKLSEVGL